MPETRLSSLGVRGGGKSNKGCSLCGSVMFGTALPSWLLSPGTVLLRRFVRNKSEPLCDIVNLVEANQHYAIVRHVDGSSFSTSSPYHPQGNGQCERINQTIWRTIKLILHGKNLPEGQWEDVLPEALHAVRSLVCLSTNETPHERFFRFPRRAMFGTTLPSWLLSPGTVLLRRFVRNKSDPLCDIVDLVEANQHYAIVRHADGSESSLSTSDLAPYPRSESDATSDTTEDTSPADVTSRTPTMEERVPDEPEESTDTGEKNDVTHGLRDFGGEASVALRRSNRERRPPDRYGDWTT